MLIIQGFEWVPASPASMLQKGRRGYVEVTGEMPAAAARSKYVDNGGVGNVRMYTWYRRSWWAVHSTWYSPF